jgi:hypothetical protein
MAAKNCPVHMTTMRSKFLALNNVGFHFKLHEFKKVLRRWPSFSTKEQSPGEVIPALGFEILSFDLQMLARGKKF